MASHANPIRAFSLALALIGCSGGPEAGEIGPGSVDQEFSTTPGEPNHEEITGTALAFLKPEILIALQAANVATDVQFFLVNANHFDDCNFSGGSEVVRTSEAEAVTALGPDQPTVEGDALAIRAFGRALHAVQDFYAHTNWVELGGDVLLDRRLGTFPRLGAYTTVPSTGFVIVQGTKPKQTVDRDEAAPYPKSAVVTIKPEGPKGKPAGSLGLISGTVDYEPGDFCPESVAMTHEELNKDKSTLVDRSQQYEAAKTLAILQSEHEWCRLRALTGKAWGATGVARLDAWVAEGAVTPSCEGELPQSNGPLPAAGGRPIPG